MVLCFVACNSRDGLEGDAADRLARELVELALLGGVDAAAQLPASVVTGLARRLQGHDDLGGPFLGILRVLGLTGTSWNRARRDSNGSS